MKYLTLTAITIWCFMACSPFSKEIESISVVELEKRMTTPSIQLLDVRTPEEWNEGIIKNAIKIDVTSDDFETKATQVLDKSKKVYVYCRSGGRSLLASKILKDKGYKVCNIEGGYNAWKEKETTKDKK